MSYQSVDWQDTDAGRVGLRVLAVGKKYAEFEAVLYESTQPLILIDYAANGGEVYGRTVDFMFHVGELKPGTRYDFEITIVRSATPHVIFPKMIVTEI